MHRRLCWKVSRDPFLLRSIVFIGTGCSRLTIYTCGSFNEVGTRAAKGFAGGSIKRERVAGLRWDDEAGTRAHRER